MMNILQAEFGISEHHQSIMNNYIRFIRYQRAQNLKAIEYSFQDFTDSRILEQTYTSEEVRELLQNVAEMVRAETETELISQCHMNVLILQQLLLQADKWHLRLQVDLSEVQNRDQLEKVAAWEKSVSSSVTVDKSPTKLKLAPIQNSMATSLINAEIDRLKSEIQSLEDSLERAQLLASTRQKEVTRLDSEVKYLETKLGVFHDQSLQHTKSTSTSNQQIETELKMSDILNGLNFSEQSKTQLQNELEIARGKVAEVQSQLHLAEQELERKFCETAAYKNMKHMLSSKNDQLRELRNKLGTYNVDRDAESAD